MFSWIKSKEVCCGSLIGPSGICAVCGTSKNLTQGIETRFCEKCICDTPHNEANRCLACDGTTRQGI